MHAKSQWNHHAVLSAIILTSLVACGEGPRGERGARGEPGEPGERGAPGAPGAGGVMDDAGTPGASCTVEDNGGGSRTIRCSDGTSVTVTDGADGDDGVSCTVVDNGDSKTISCSDGTTAVVRDGAPGALSFSLAAEPVETLSLEIKSVVIASPPVVELILKDGAGRGATGLMVDGSGASNLRFTLAKLVPGAEYPERPGTFAPDHWQSYIQRASGDHSQATYDRAGTLVDHGDGRYTYTFKPDVTAATDPVSGAPITWEPTLTHRLAIELRGNVAGKALPIVNTSFDFVPAGGPVSRRRDIVATASCNECHGTLRAHGGRIDTKYCVTCHNPGTSSAEGSADFTPLIHGIHSAGYRKQIVSDIRAAGATPTSDFAYELGGHSYNEVTYPQSLDNCLKCHDGRDPETPQGGNWQHMPTAQACTGCHAAVDLDTDPPTSVDPQDYIPHVDHFAGKQSDATCGTANCHGGEKLALEHASEDPTPNTPSVVQDASGEPPITIEYEISSVTTEPVDANNSAEGDFAVVTFRILANSQPLDLLDADAMAPLDGANPSMRAPSFLLAYALPQDGIDAPADYNNRGKSAAQPASVAINKLMDGSQGTLAPAANGAFTAVLKGSGNSAAFPAGATLRAVALQGYFQQVDFPRAGSKLSLHAISVEAPVEDDPVRREVVDSARCASCHEWFLGHGGNRVYATDVCVMCHVPNLSSGGRGASAGSWHASNPTEGLSFDIGDPLSYPEEGNSFKTLIHSIHASAKRTHAFEFVRHRGSAYYYDFSEVTFPGVLNDCETCHKAGTYGADLPPDALVSTDRITSGDDNNTSTLVAARAAVPNATDLVSTPVSAACVGCHDAPIATSHMEDHGGLIRAQRGDAFGYVETCALCHGPGRVADVSVVHDK